MRLSFTRRRTAASPSRSTVDGEEQSACIEDLSCDELNELQVALPASYGDACSMRLTEERSKIPMAVTEVDGKPGTSAPRSPWATFMLRAGCAVPSPRT
ncbi:MAG: hypothetical protein R2755_01100 [Acidimicrobiales bacterium]